MKHTFIFVLGVALLPLLMSSHTVISAENAQPTTTHYLQKQDKTLKILFNRNNGEILEQGEVGYISIGVKDEQGEPIQGARVTMELPVGIFQDFGRRDCSGLTSQHGWFLAYWRAPERVGRYEGSYTASYAGYESRSGNFIMEVKAKEKTLGITFSASPNPAHATGKSQLAFFVYEEGSSRKTYLDGVRVEVDASTGFFPLRYSRSISGTTRNGGEFQIEWQAPEQTGSCKFTAYVWADGYPPIEEEFSLNIRPRPAGNASLSGRVLNSRGRQRNDCVDPQGLYEVVVALEHTGNGSTYRAVVSGNCTYRFSGLPSGYYRTRISVNEKGADMPWLPLSFRDYDDTRLNLRSGGNRFDFYTTN